MLHMAILSMFSTVNSLVLPDPFSPPISNWTREWIWQRETTQLTDRVHV